MSIVSRSHVDLVRARKALEHAFEARDWTALREWDKRLGASLNSAFEDSGRDAHELVQELERVLGLYAAMMEALPEDAQRSLYPRS